MFFTRLQKPLIEIKDLFAAGSLLVRCCFSSPEESSLVFFFFFFLKVCIFFFNLFIYGCVGSSFLCEGFL